FYEYINKVFTSGVTSGCDDALMHFCPDNYVSREKTAAALMNLRYQGNLPAVAPSPQLFSDVPPGSPHYLEIQLMGSLGIPTGCVGGKFCPGEILTRDQTAVLLLRTVNFTDPMTTVPQRFSDVATTSPYFGFIDQLAARKITMGCSATGFCPLRQITY